MSIRDLLIGLLLGGAISLGIYAVWRARAGGGGSSSSPSPQYKAVAFENVEEWEVVEDEEGNLRKIIVHRSVRPLTDWQVKYRDAGEASR